MQTSLIVQCSAHVQMHADKHGQQIQLCISSHLHHANTLHTEYWIIHSPSNCHTLFLPGFLCLEQTDYCCLYIAQARCTDETFYFLEMQDWFLKMWTSVQKCFRHPACPHRHSVIRSDVLLMVESGLCVFSDSRQANAVQKGQQIKVWVGSSVLLNVCMWVSLCSCKSSLPQNLSTLNSSLAKHRKTERLLTRDHPAVKDINPYNTTPQMKSYFNQSTVQSAETLIN